MSSEAEEIDAVIALNRGDPSPLVALLRAERTLHHDVQELLATVLSPRGASKWRLIGRRRRAGCPPSNPSHRFPTTLINRVSGKLTREDRELLASMIDPSGTSDWTLRFDLRKGGQRIGTERKVRRALSEAMEIGGYVKSLIDGGQKPSRATKSATAHFGKSLSSIKNAWSLYQALESESE
jgi:hypothetical protein